MRLNQFITVVPRRRCFKNIYSSIVAFHKRKAVMKNAFFSTFLFIQKSSKGKKSADSLCWSLSVSVCASISVSICETCLCLCLFLCICHTRCYHLYSSVRSPHPFITGHLYYRLPFNVILLILFFQPAFRSFCLSVSLLSCPK